jgi:MFS family permease
MKKEGKTSSNPIKESFANKENLKLVAIALFGAAMGQGVVWYTGQFYALSFLQKTMNIEFVQSNVIIAIALLLGTPFFIYFGSLSDRIGRKKIMLTGMLVAALAYFPIYRAMDNIGNVKLKTEQTELFKIESSTTKNDAGETITKTTRVHSYSDGSTLKETGDKKELTVSNFNVACLVLLIFIQVIFVTMVYAPIAAFLVELFPTRIRYTSMSLPYHIGNGVFGGLLPTISTILVTNTNNHLAGLIYPIGIALICFVVGIIYLKDKKGIPL